MKSSSTLSWESFESEIIQAEKDVSQEFSSYKGLDSRALSTSPEDILSIIDDPLIKGTWVDLGSGLGHTVLTYAQRFPERRAIGVEWENSRAEVSRKIARENNILNSFFVTADLLNCDLPNGDIYFIYFPQGHVLDRILSELSKKDNFVLIAIESHGDLFPRLEREKWLTLEKSVPLKAVRHDAFARIYRPNQNPRMLSGLHQLSFIERFLLIHDGNTKWWADSFGLFASGEKYQLVHPPRTITESNVVKIVTKEELSPVESFLVSLRRSSGLVFSSGGRTYQGPLRKILISPAFSVEFPCGERVEWGSIDWIKQGNFLCYDSSSQFFSLPPAH